MLRNIYLLRFLYFLIIIIIILIYYFSNEKYTNIFSKQLIIQEDKIYIWCTFTRTKQNDFRFQNKFQNFIISLKNNTDYNLSLNVIIDKSSKFIAKNILNNILFTNNSKYDNSNKIQVVYHDIDPIVFKLENLIKIMKPFFTPGNNTYYGNALFYISLGLHRVVPKEQNKIILIDIDVQIEAPISKLYQHFYNFKSNMLFGLANELSPVYLHNLQRYRKKYPTSKLGLSRSENGNQGYNSGVVLLDIEKLRNSEKYKKLTEKSYIKYLTLKYMFVGHLGDQDFYTLLSFEYPELIYTLPCQWNRSLCQWWRLHGYQKIFYKYFQCEGEIFLYHGNCNTPLNSYSVS